MRACVRARVRACVPANTGEQHSPALPGPGPCRPRGASWAPPPGCRPRCTRPPRTPRCCRCRRTGRRPRRPVGWSPCPGRSWARCPRRPHRSAWRPQRPAWLRRGRARVGAEGPSGVAARGCPPATLGPPSLIARWLLLLLVRLLLLLLMGKVHAMRASTSAPPAPPERAHTHTHTHTHTHRCAPLVGALGVAEADGEGFAVHLGSPRRAQRPPLGLRAGARCSPPAGRRPVLRPRGCLAQPHGGHAAHQQVAELDGLKCACGQTRLLLSSPLRGLPCPQCVPHTPRIGPQVFSGRLHCSGGGHSLRRPSHKPPAPPATATATASRSPGWAARVGGRPTLTYNHVPARGAQPVCYAHVPAHHT